MEIISIKAETRATVGSKSSKTLRREGKIPCVMYGGEEIAYFSVEPSQVKHLIYTPDFKLASIEVDGVEHRCILKDLQVHPVTDQIVHIDFLKLIEGKPIKVEIPIGFTGVSPGVKGGGRLVQNIRAVMVKTYPSELVDKLYVSIEGLLLGQSVRIKDVETIGNMQILNPMATPIAGVQVPRALKSATEGEEGEEGEGEGEVLEEGEEAAEATE